MSAQHTPGPWELLDYGNAFLVRREIDPHRVQYLLNAKGKQKVFRKRSTALAAIAKATGSAA